MTLDRALAILTGKPVIKFPSTEECQKELDIIASILVEAIDDINQLATEGCCRCDFCRYTDHSNDEMCDECTDGDPKNFVWWYWEAVEDENANLSM